MKKKVLAYLMVCVLVMSMCMPVHATGETNAETVKSLTDSSITVAQVYLTKGDETPVPHAMIVDGTTLLEEGEDYTLSVEEVDDGWVYYDVTITGIGDYASEDSSLTYSVDEEMIGEVDTYGDWKFLGVWDEENEEYSVYILSYTGDAENVTIPEYLDADKEEADDDYIAVYCVYDILGGTFYNRENLQSVDFGWCVPGATGTFVNCPKLSEIKWEEEYWEIYEELGPLVLGELDGELSVMAPTDFYWSYYTEDDDEIEITLTEYCEEYGYQTETTEDLFVDGDWTYQLSESYAEAKLISYTGEDASVEIPEYINDGDDFDIYEVETNAFDGLDTLEEIDMGQATLISYMCNDCPNLKTIICRSEDMELDGPIVGGESVPEEGQLTIYAYPGIEWIVEDPETGEESIRTLEEYCAEYGYVYKELKGEYVAFDIVTEDESGVAIAGDLKQLDVTVETENDSDYLDAVFPDATIKDWKVVGSGVDYAHISNTGELTIGTKVDKEMTILIQCTVVRQTTNANGEETTKETTVSGYVTAYPRLSGNPVVLLPKDKTKTLSCKQNVFGEDNWGVEEADLPEDVEVVYEVTGDEIVTVEDGVVTAAESAEVGAKTTVKATYTIGEQDYTFVYEIEIIEPVDVSEIGEETIYVYGWAGCGFDKMVSVFEAMYEELAGQIEYVELDPEEEMNEEEYVFWDVYAGMIEEAMEGENPPDIVLWPEDYAATYAQTAQYVSLDQIGFEASSYDKAFAYVKGNGMAGDKLYAVTNGVNPGCFVYNKAIAKEVFGTDEPAKVQEKVKDWATFIASAKQMREKEYYMLSNLDLEYPLFGGRTSSWVKDNTLSLEEKAVPYLSLMRQLYLAEAVDPDDFNWDAYGAIDYYDNCFGFFADANYLLHDSEFRAHKDAYDICVGPVYFTNEEAPYMTVTTTRNNDQLTNLLLTTLVSNKTVLEACMTNGLSIANYEDVVAERAATDTKYATWLEVLRNMQVLSKSPTDNQIEDYLVYYYSIYYWLEEEISKEAIEAVDVNELVTNMQDGLKDMYPSVEVTAPEKIEWKDFTQEENPGGNGGTSGGESGGNSGEGDDPIVDPNPGQTPGTDSEKDPVQNVTPAPNPGTTDTTVKPNPGTTVNPNPGTSTGNTTFGKNSKFTKSNNKYKVLSIKGKTGTVAWLGVKSKSAKKIKIPNTVKKNAVTFKVVTIADKACKNNKKVTKITIPKNVTTIGKYAFSGCKKLKSIKISSKKLKKVGKKALKGINKKAVIDVPNSKVKSYKRLFKKKGQAKTVKIK